MLQNDTFSKCKIFPKSPLRRREEGVQKIAEKTSYLRRDAFVDEPLACFCDKVGRGVVKRNIPINSLFLREFILLFDNLQSVQSLLLHRRLSDDDKFNNQLCKYTNTYTKSLIEQDE